MITFRFYVVSMTALFLALALGVVIGSALDESIVETLNNRIATVDHRLDDLGAENDELRAAVERDREVFAAAALHLVDGAMAGSPVLVVAERGVDADGVRALQGLVTASGAVTPGILWLEKSWVLGDEDARVALAAELDVSVAEAEVLRGRAWRLLAEQLRPVAVPDVTAPGAEGAVPATPSTSPTTTAPGAGAPGTTAGPTTTAAPVTTTTLPPVPIDALAVLDEAGLVTLEALAEDGPTLEAIIGQEVTVIVISARGADLEGTDFVAQLVEIQTEVGVPTVLGALTEDGDPGDALVAVRDDEALAERVSTVDNGQLPEGRAAIVLAAADLRRAIVGHYGDLPSADRVLPAWTAPSPEPG